MRLVISRVLRRLALAGCLTSLALSPGCASAVVLAEQSLVAAEPAWHDAYLEAADECEALHAPHTPEMRTCFGGWAQADAAVEVAVLASVAAIRTYWRARAAGERPSAAEVLSLIAAALDDLPPEATAYFGGVARRIAGGAP